MGKPIGEPVGPFIRALIRALVGAFVRVAVDSTVGSAVGLAVGFADCILVNDILWTVYAYLTCSIKVNNIHLRQLVYLQIPSLRNHK